MALFTRDNTPVHPLGIGTWEIGGGLYMPSKKHYADYSRDEKDIAALRYALSLGQNHIDGAHVYSCGHADELSGDAMSTFPREKVFFASKINISHALRNAFLHGVEDILRRAKTDYLDLLYVHAPFPEVPMTEYLGGLKDAYEAGMTRYIGLSNFDLEQLHEAEQILGMSPHALQNRCSVLFKRDIGALLDYCSQQDIAYVAYRPMERGEVQKNAILHSIAQKHNATPEQIALAWLLQHDILPIPKATQQEHMNQNFQAYNITLTEEEMALIAKIPDIL